MPWDVLSGVTKSAWDVLSGVANLCGMFCPGCQKTAWDVMSRDVLSYIPHDLFERKPKEGFLCVFLTQQYVLSHQEGGPWYSISRFKYFEKYPISLKRNW